MKIIQVPPTLVPAWIGNDHMYMAVNHNRYDCGIYVLAGDIIKVKVSHDDVRFNLWNDNSQTELNVTLSAHDMNNSDDYFEHVVEYDSVPFFECMLNGVEYTAQITPTTTRSLPKFVYGQTNEFEWPDDAPFAILVSDYIQILVPKIDRSVLTDVPTINSILAWYEDVINFYDSLVGLTNATITVNDNLLNSNPNKRFFAKANISGAGGGYYSQFTMGENGPSVARFYLRPLPINWGGLHEIAHAYDFEFVRSGPVPLNEVWNNILCDAYQSRYLDLDEKSVNTPNALDVGQNIIQKIENNENFNKYSFFEKLAIFSYIMELDSNIFVKINRDWRAHRLGQDIGNLYFLPVQKFVPPMQVWWITHSQFDLIPVFNTVLLPCDDWQIKEYNRLTTNKPTVIFWGMFDDDATIPLELKSINENSMATGIVTITIHIANFLDIRGQIMTLIAGSQTTLSFIITESSFDISVVSGIYKVFMPRGKGYLTYTITTSDYENYLLVQKNSHRECHIYYNAQYNSFLCSEFGRFYGLNDRNAGFLNVNYTTKRFEILSINPFINTNFGDQVYTSFTLSTSNTKNNVKDEFNVMSLDMPYTRHVYYDLDIKDNNVYTWTIYHAQSNMNRMNFLSQLLLRQQYVFTLYGVSRQGLNANQSAKNNLKIKIQNCIHYIDNSQLKLPFNVDNLFSDSIYAAINKLDFEDKNELLQKYQNYLPVRFQLLTPSPVNLIVFYVIAAIVVLLLIIFIIIYNLMTKRSTVKNSHVRVE
jgi:hypothetical protein